MAFDIKALRQKKTDLLNQAEAVLNRAQNESRALTDAERTEYDGLLEQTEVVTGDIERTEKLMDQQRTLTSENHYGEAARVAVPNAAKKPWDNFGEQLLAVRNAAVTHSRDVDSRLLNAQGANESVDSEGGFLVAPEFATEILQRTYSTGVVSSRCREIPMNSSRLILPAVDEDSRADGQRWGGLQAFWQAEAAKYTGTKAKFRDMQLTANKLTALLYTTEELQDDAAALTSYSLQAAPDELAFKIDDAVLNGTGAGMPLGTLLSGAVIVQPKDANQTAVTITTDNILGMWSRLWAASRSNAVWFVNQSIETQLLKLTLGSGTAVVLLYTPPGMYGNDSPYGLLLGRPVIPIEQTAALGTQGDILLADMSQYLLGKKGGLRADSSIHVAFLTGEECFRFMLRVDGQPTWKKPLTPKSGGPTLSPFVTLATRS